MAATYTPAQAFDMAKRFIKNMPLEQVQTQILSDVSAYLWMSAPWRWSIGTFPLITLASTTQDYTVILPADFLYIQDAYITDALGNVPLILHVEPQLPPGGKQGTPSRIAVVSGSPGGSGTVRLFPFPGSIPAGWQVITRYKKQAPVIQAKNLNTAGQLVFDDEWVHVFNSGVQYYAYLFGDDQRAGSAQIDPASGKVTFSGQRGVFEANISLMKTHEKLIGTPTVFPEQKETK